MTSAPVQVQSAVDCERLDEQRQAKRLAAWNCLWAQVRGPLPAQHSGPSLNWCCKLRQGVARQQSRLAARLVIDPLVAIYNVPSKEKSTTSEYFCEACSACIPAREQDWQIHSTGIDHQCQILSLCGTGELGHMPLGDPHAMAGIWRLIL